MNAEANEITAGLHAPHHAIVARFCVPFLRPALAACTHSWRQWPGMASVRLLDH
jgi:hypothetical protein